MSLSVSDNSRFMSPTSILERANVFFNELFDRNLFQYNRTRDCTDRLLYLCFVSLPEVVVNRRPPFSLREDPYPPKICLSFHYKQLGPPILYRLYLSPFCSAWNVDTLTV